MKPWIEKAHKIIHSECLREYKEKNFFPNGKQRKKYVPYSVPELALELRDCINKNDEERAKAIFLRLNLPPLVK